jgi:hypothetical protein
MSLDTTNWVKYPFSVAGVEFVSMLDPQGSFYSAVKRLPAGIFVEENSRMVSELIGNPAKFTRNELEAELARVNDGASQAILALA